MNALHAAPLAPTDDPPVLRVGELELRPEGCQLLLAGRHVSLTRREFELLYVLAESMGRVLPRATIFARVWGGSMPVRDRSVDVFVRKLRGKLRRAEPGLAFIHTHFGVGYRFSPEPVTER